MAKFSKQSRLSLTEEAELIIEFCHSLVDVRSPTEAARLITDLLSPQEAAMLAKRLKIAKLLLAKKTYKEIEEIMKVSPTTISRVAGWLEIAGDGYRTAAKRVPHREQKIKTSLPWQEELDRMKRRYPLHFLIPIIIEDIGKLLDKKERESWERALEKIHSKPAFYRQLQKSLER